MKDYSMSDEVFLLRALEEDGCMISAVGIVLVKAMMLARESGTQSQLLNESATLYRS